MRHATLAVLAAALSVAAAQTATPGAMPAKTFVVDPASGTCLNCEKGDPSAEVVEAVRACEKVDLEDWFAKRFVRDAPTRRPLGEKGQAGRIASARILYGLCLTLDDGGLVCYEVHADIGNEGRTPFFARYDENGKVLWRRRSTTSLMGLVYPFVTDSEIIYGDPSAIVFLSLRTGRPVREVRVKSELCPVEVPWYIHGADDPKGCVAGVFGRYAVLQAERRVASDVKARKGGWVRQNACVVPIGPAAEK